MTASKFELFLQRVFKATGIESQNELARALNVNRSAITQAKKKNSVPDKWILQLVRFFGINPDWLETGKEPVFINNTGRDEDTYIHIPKVKARISAGGGSFETGSEIECYYSFKKDWLKKKGISDKMILMDIFGNSMEPELKYGDTVMIDTSQKDILAGEIYAVGIEDTIMVKRIEKHPNRLALLSDNKNYSPVYLGCNESNSFRIIGKVIWVCREFK